MSGRLPSCDGYIDLQYRFSVNELIRDSDVEKLIKHKDLIQQLITESWGEFEHVENNLIAKGGYNFDMPYMFIESYKKPSP